MAEFMRTIRDPLQERKDNIRKEKANIPPPASKKKVPSSAEKYFHKVRGLLRS
jgi:hypothetical protein